MTIVEWVGLVALVAILLGALAAFVSKCIDFGMHGRQIQKLQEEIHAYKNGWACPVCEKDDAEWDADWQRKSEEFIQRNRQIMADAVLSLVPPTTKRRH